MKKLGLALVSAIFLTSSALAADASATAAQSTDVKIAVVNVQQILQQSPRVADLSKQLENQFKDRQQKLNDEQKSLQDEIDNFKKEEPTMSQKDRDAKQKKIADERAELVKKVVAYQQDVNKAQTKIMQGIQNELNGIVTGLAKKGNFDMVLDAQAVIFAIDGKDITKDVADQFNSKK